MKRFYKLVTTGAETGDGFSILLDGKKVKTQGKSTLCSPNIDIANEVMREWADQGDKIIPATMPLTQILNTKIDRVATEREQMSNEVLKYLNTDLLCYRAEEPLEVAKLQAQGWDQWLEWFTQYFSETLKITTGLSALEHQKSVHAKVSEHVKALDDNYFTILQMVTPMSGSLILALAFTSGEATTQQVFNASRIEENFKAKLYNAEKYGPDPMQEKKDKAMILDLEASEKFLSFL